jgi:predicted 3-demethylubiquinone-9 3-methyltransferase (glyoxalase superfamily)
MSVQAITPFLWFDDQAEAAAEFYVATFPNSKILHVSRHAEGGPGRPGSAMTVEFELQGLRFMALNGGPMFSFSEAISFLISCETQDEVDTYWARLSDGGSQGRCGWLKDRFGLSWQVVPTVLSQLMADPRKAGRVTQAMLKMNKLDIEGLRRAAEGA